MAGSRSIPLVAASCFTVWMVLWMPIVLWAYGPQNFLWVCNIAQFVVLYAVWRDDRLALSSQAGTVCIVGLAWTLDLLLALATGGLTASFTAYMFNPELPLIARLSSLYHVGLPAFVIWLLRRTGYDDRGWRLQCMIGGVAVVAGWLLTEPRRNVNWVHQPFGIEQSWMPAVAFVALLLVAYPVAIYLPGHALVRFLLSRVCRGGAA